MTRLSFASGVRTFEPPPEYPRYKVCALGKTVGHPPVIIVPVWQRLLAAGDAVKYGGGGRRG